MTNIDPAPSALRRTRGRTATWTTFVAVLAVLLMVVIVAPGSAGAAESPVALGTAAAYSVLGGQTVTNTGTSVLSDDLGVSPGTAITGFPPGVSLGTIHAGDAVAGQAQSDLTIAYNSAASRATTEAVSGDLVGRTLVAGVYTSTSSLALSGTLTLDAQGDPTWCSSSRLRRRSSAPPGAASC